MGESRRAMPNVRSIADRRAIAVNSPAQRKGLWDWVASNDNSTVKIGVSVIALLTLIILVLNSLMPALINAGKQMREIELQSEQIQALTNRATKDEQLINSLKTDMDSMQKELDRVQRKGK